MNIKPLVSIITPSLNMGEFLADAIESVLSQDYSNIEYIVMDGGSTDGTLDLLRRYRGRLRYLSAVDGGTADAINRGFELSQGSLLAWLNADDTYLPGAVTAAVATLESAPEVAAVYGNGYWTDADGAVLRPYPTQLCDWEHLGRECCVCQPACFMRRTAFERVGRLDTTLQSAFDYDLWIRFVKLFRLVHLDRYVATSRMHSGTKTLGNREQMFQESFEILKRHYKYVPLQWVYGRFCYRLDGRNQFTEPLRYSAIRYLLSFPYGCWHNPRNLRRFALEWISRLGSAAYPLYRARAASVWHRS